jgi:hypothetical protein
MNVEVGLVARREPTRVHEEGVVQQGVHCPYCEERRRKPSQVREQRVYVGLSGELG